MFGSLFSVPEPRSWIPDRSRNCSVYIGTPPSAPTSWQKARAFDKKHITLENGSRIRVQDVVAYLVVYPNGEILKSRNIFYPLPDGVRGLEALTTERIYYRFDPIEVDRGNSVCRVTNGDFRQDGQKNIYRTTLTNLSDQFIRILKFASFVVSSDQQYRLNTVSGDFYSCDQFAAWFAAADGWIAPGKSVFDDANYGSGNGVWAYFGETESGEKFVATVELPRS